ncbi:MAG: hypothetical protein AAF533_00185 [Acidobacteriota bacterium]
MRRDTEHFMGEELELVQLARRLKEAKAVEECLTEAGIDYHVAAEEYIGTLLFIPRRRIGAHFYVRPEIAESTRDLLREKGFFVVEVEHDD